MGLGVQGFHLLMAMLHFKMTGQQVESFEPGVILDRMEMAHRVNPMDNIVMYNLVQP